MSRLKINLPYLSKFLRQLRFLKHEKLLIVLLQISTSSRSSIQISLSYLFQICSFFTAALGRTTTQTLDRNRECGPFQVDSYVDYFSVCHTDESDINMTEDSNFQKGPSTKTHRSLVTIF